MNDDNDVRKVWLSSIAEDIADIRRHGTQVVIVSSGAVGLGKKVLGIASGPLRLEEKQAAAACGQTLLMQAWRDSLLEHGFFCAQILLTIDDSENRRRYLNARSTLETLLENGVIPVINENDTVATAELRFGDNDRLAARVAQMVSADYLVLFSDIDGFYTSNPHKDKNAKLIDKVSQITPEIDVMAGAATSAVGSGGMITKIDAARIALAAGCHMVIAAGKIMHPLRELENPGNRTWFIASSTPVNARKNWIMGSIVPSGSIIIDDGAVQALAVGKSLLPAGVKKIDGYFERGDTVIVKNTQNKELGRGIISYSSTDAALIMGHKISEIERLLGFKGRNALIHKDDLVLIVY